MIIRTKKFRLRPFTYVRIAFLDVLRHQWWVAVGFVLAFGTLIFFRYTGWAIAWAVVCVLYWLFWVVQFYGVTFLQENKLLFEDLSYHISSDHLTIQLTPKQGMVVQWPQIDHAHETRKSFILFLSKAQFIYLPHRAFHSKEEVKLVRMLLQRKKLI